MLSWPKQQVENKNHRLRRHRYLLILKSPYLLPQHLWHFPLNIWNSHTSYLSIYDILPWTSEIPIPLTSASMTFSLEHLKFPYLLPQHLWHFPFNIWSPHTSYLSIYDIFPWTSEIPIPLTSASMTFSLEHLKFPYLLPQHLWHFPLNIWNSHTSYLSIYDIFPWTSEIPIPLTSASMTFSLEHLKFPYLLPQHLWHFPIPLTSASMTFSWNSHTSYLSIYDILPWTSEIPIPLTSASMTFSLEHLKFPYLLPQHLWHFPLNIWNSHTSYLSIYDIFPWTSEIPIPLTSASMTFSLEHLKFPYLLPQHLWHFPLNIWNSHTSYLSIYDILPWTSEIPIPLTSASMTFSLEHLKFPYLLPQHLWHFPLNIWNSHTSYLSIYDILPWTSEIPIPLTSASMTFSLEHLKFPYLLPQHLWHFPLNIWNSHTSYLSIYDIFPWTSEIPIPLTSASMTFSLEHLKFPYLLPQHLWHPLNIWIPIPLTSALTISHLKFPYLLPQHLWQSPLIWNSHTSLHLWHPWTSSPYLLPQHLWHFPLNIWNSHTSYLSIYDILPWTSEIPIPLTSASMTFSLEHLKFPYLLPQHLWHFPLNIWSPHTSYLSIYDILPWTSEIPIPLTSASMTFSLEHLKFPYLLPQHLWHSPLNIWNSHTSYLSIYDIFPWTSEIPIPLTSASMTFSLKQKPLTHF